MRSFLLLSAAFASAFASASTVPQDMQDAECDWDGTKIVCPEGADLGGAVLTNADLRGAYLRNAVLTGADLLSAFLTNVDLTGADLRGADLRGASLFEADLSGVDLSGASLSGVDLTNAKLENARLERADLSGADLSGADLSGAYLFEADLDGTKLYVIKHGSGVQGLPEVVLNHHKLVFYAKDLLSRADASQMFEILSDVDPAYLAAAYHQNAVAQACQATAQ